MKKLFAVLMAMALVLTMGTTFAFAAGNGSITITNAIAGEDYEIYKILDFTPVEGTNGQKGYYAVGTEWEGFFAQAPASGYFEVKELDGKKVVTMTAKEEDMDMPALAKAAIAYAKNNGIAATATATASGTTVEFTGLDLGYYAVDTSLGAICALTNTNSTDTLVEKNAKPDITKQVEEDRDLSWGNVNDADIGQVVNYKSTVTVGSGLTEYVMHDKMDVGLTFDSTSVVVEGATAGTDYTLVTEGLDDGCTFEIRFNDAFIERVGKGKTFDVTYSATLNENAKVAHDKGNDEYEGNKNTAQLTYKNEDKVESSEKHETVTFTWKLDVFKYTMDGDSKTPLAGATFQLLDANGNAIKFSKVGDTTTYVVDPVNGTTDVTTGVTGNLTFIGLDEVIKEGNYTLVETKAPEGYNRAKDTEIVINSTLDQDNYAAEYYFVETDENGDANNVAPETIEVENKTGGLFPETGGIGTTIFYIVGGLLMLAAFVVLVSKKRMATFA